MLNQLLVYVKRIVLKVKLMLYRKTTWRNIEGSGWPRVEKK